MNLLELAQKRCSVRKYASFPVEDEKLAYILEAGRMAPSAVKKQEGQKSRNAMHANGSGPHRSIFLSAATTASHGNVLRIRKIIWTSMWQSPRNISA